MQEHTTFFFDVSPPYLQEALDRFAQFFTTPLMLAGSLEREVSGGKGGGGLVVAGRGEEDAGRQPGERGGGVPGGTYWWGGARRDVLVGVGEGLLAYFRPTSSLLPAYFYPLSVCVWGGLCNIQVLY